MSKVFLFLICLFLPISLLAQTTVDKSLVKMKPPRAFHQEIRLGGGYYTYPLVNEISFTKEKERNLFQANTPQSNGVYALSFFGFVNKEWNIGIHLSLENLQGSIHRQVFDSALHDTITATTVYKVKAISIFPTAYKYWRQSKHLNLYSGVGLGITLKSYDLSGNLDIGRTEDTKLGLAFQVIALGVRLGNQYAGFAELGFGNIGILQLGFSAGF
mgnify:CR=1 FL=1